MDSVGELLDLLGGDLDRRILELTDEQPRSAEEVAKHCDASLPTVYRHIDDLTSAGLLRERTEYDKRGNHYKTYTAALQEATIRVEDGELTLSLSTAQADEQIDDSPKPEGIEEVGSPAAEEIERPDSEE